MNKRTGNIRRKQPKRRYHDRRGLADAKSCDEVPGMRRGIDIADVQPPKGFATYEGSAQIILGDPKLRAENEGLKKSLADLEEKAKHAEWDRQIHETRCSCGHKLPSTYDSTYVCRCGRQYDPPKLNVCRVLARISELEDRVKQLESVIRTKPEGA